MKIFSFAIALLLASNNAWAADNIFGDPMSGTYQMKDNSGRFWNANLADTTNGNGDIYTLSGLVAGDNIIGGGSTHLLIDNTGRRWPLSVWYTTDGSGNVTPVIFNAIKSLNSLTGSSQTLVTGSTGTDFAIVSSGSSHSFNLPVASASASGKLSSGDWSIFNAKQAAIPTYQNTYWVNKAGTDSGSCGSIQSPCLTISQALTNIGVSATAADVKNAKTVIIGAGAYDESLTIPSGRIVTLLAEGMVVLGDGAGTNWASTTPRSISWNPVAADLHGSDVKPALTIGAYSPSDATSTFIAESHNFTISGNLTMNGDGTTKTLNLHGVKIWGNISHTDASLVNWQSYRTLVVGTVSTTGNLVLERAYDSRFNGLLSVNAVNMAFNSNFPGGITVQSVQQNLLPNGFFHCNISGTFTGVASSARFDAATYQYFRANSAALAGGATIVNLDDTVLSQSASAPTCTASLRGLQWLVQGGAGIADIYQVCQKNSSDAYVWTTH